jgi:hypothetical protein
VNRDYEVNGRLRDQPHGSHLYRFVKSRQEGSGMRTHPQERWKLSIPTNLTLQYSPDQSYKIHRGGFERTTVTYMMDVSSDLHEVGHTGGHATIGANR